MNILLINKMLSSAEWKVLCHNIILVDGNRTYISLFFSDECINEHVSKTPKQYVF